MIQDKDVLYWQLRQEQEDFLQRQHWWWYHFINGTLKSHNSAFQLAQEAEWLVAKQMASFGYYVYPTTHKTPFDLWVENDAGHAIKAEVKISRYNQHKRGGRYQCNVRHHQADILVFICRNDRDWPFVIPLDEVYPRMNITIWAAHPDQSRGQWAPYLQAWHHLHQAVSQAPSRPRQLTIFEKPILFCSRPETQI
jgi:hypothetical protein